MIFHAVETDKHMRHRREDTCSECTAKAQRLIMNMRSAINAESYANPIL